MSCWLRFMVFFLGLEFGYCFEGLTMVDIVFPASF